jgi:hypothetical protein
MIDEQCIDVVSLENGHAEKLGLPVPDATEETPRAP